MSQRKNYSRYFIILQEDEKGYGIASDKLPTGYAKLEVKNGKCKISFYAQNLKKEMKPYNMVLIFSGNNNNKLVTLGELNIDDTGRSEISKEYDANNVGNAKVQIEKISGAAVVRLVDNDIVSVMNGFTTKDNITDWKSYNLIDISKVEQNLERSIEPEVKDEAINFKEYEEKVEKEKEQFKDLNIEKEDDSGLKVPVNDEDITIEPIQREELDEEEVLKVVQEEKVEKLETQILRKDNSLEIKAEKNIEMSEAINLEENSDNKIQINNEMKIETNIESKTESSEMTFFKSICEGLEKWKDDFEELENCKWYKVNINCREDMYTSSSYKAYILLYFPMLNYFPYVIKSRHYLVGYKYGDKGEVKYLIYGILGTKETYDQPYGGKYGFVSWTQPSKNKGRHGDEGYWLMFYDFKKSVIVVPKNK